MDYNSYYYKYLNINSEGLKQGQRVFQSSYREVPINSRWYYPIIGTEMDGHNICSCASGLQALCNEQYDGSIESMTMLLEKLKLESSDFQLRQMSRYACSEIHLHITPKVQQLSQELIENIEFQDPTIRDDFIKRKRQIVEEGRQFVVLNENRIISMAFVSDVMEGSGNIVVYTQPEYRNHGLGKAVVSKCIKWCLDRALIPIYLVEESNLPSVQIAQAVGMKQMNREWIISQYKE